MKDLIESMEDAAEAWAWDNMRGDEFKCPGCGKWTPNAEGETLNPSPWAKPFCRKCAAEDSEGRK
jgi:hypothetical protein